MDKEKKKKKISLRKIVIEAIREIEGWQEEADDIYEEGNRKYHCDSTYKNLNKYIGRINAITDILERTYKEEGDKSIRIPEEEQDKIKDLVKLLYKNTEIKKSIMLVQDNKSLLTSELKKYVNGIMQELEQCSSAEYYVKLKEYNDLNINKVFQGKYTEYLKDIVEESLYTTLEKKHDKIWCMCMIIGTNSFKRSIKKWNVLVNIATYLHNLKIYSEDTFEKIRFEYELADSIEVTGLINIIEISGLRSSWVESDYQYIRSEANDYYNKIDLSAEQDLLQLIEEIEHLGYMTVGLGKLHDRLQEILISLFKENMEAYEKFVAETIEIRHFDESAMEEYIKINID